VAEWRFIEEKIYPACPTLIFPCEFLNFSASRFSFDLAGRKAIKELEGKEDAPMETRPVERETGKSSI